MLATISTILIGITAIVAAIVAAHVLVALWVQLPMWLMVLAIPTFIVAITILNIYLWDKRGY